MKRQAVNTKSVTKQLQQPAIQSKLMVNTPGDRYEQEADAMAEKVLNSRPAGQHITGMIGRSVQRKCQHCQQEEQKKKKLMRDGSGEGGFEVSSSFSDRLDSSRVSGTPLAGSAKDFMEHAFSADFSKVRIHTGSDAGSMSKEIRANAFTHGNDIYFNDGQFNPATGEGKRLLAHELTHVLQQEGNRKSVQRAGGVDTTDLAWMYWNQQEEARDLLERLASFDPVKDRARLRSVLTDIYAEQGQPRVTFYILNVLDYYSTSIDSVKDVGRAIREEFFGLINELETFKTLVRNASVVQLQNNIASLDLWKEFIHNRISPFELEGQVEAMRAKTVLEKSLTSRGGSMYGEMWATDTGEHSRAYNEAVATDEICPNCHNAVRSRALDNELGTYSDSPLQRLNAHVTGMQYYDRATPMIDGQMLEGSGIPENQLGRFGFSEGTRRMANMVNEIKPYLDQIGPNGFETLPDDVFLSNRSAVELKDMILNSMTARQGSFTAAIPEIQDPDFDYLELIPILKLLLPTQSAEVQRMVKRDQDDKNDPSGEIFAGIAIFLLTIFPPTTAVGIALGAGAGLYQGYKSYELGRIYRLGTTGGIFTHEQEEAASSLTIMGVVNMVLGVIGIGQSSISAVRFVRGPADEIVGATAKAAGTEVEVSLAARGEPMVTIREGGETSFSGTAGELEELAARASNAKSLANTTDDELRALTGELPPMSDLDAWHFESELAARRAGLGHDDGMLAAGRTDIEALKNNTYDGASPRAGGPVLEGVENQPTNPQGPTAQFGGVGKPHAEGDVVNQMVADIEDGFKNGTITEADLDGKTLMVAVEDKPCPVCGSWGRGGNKMRMLDTDQIAWTSSLYQTSRWYPNLTLRIVFPDGELIIKGGFGVWK